MRRCFGSLWVPGVLSLFLSGCVSVPGIRRRVRPTLSRAVIHVPEPHPLAETAATALQVHLDLRTGYRIPIIAGECPAGGEDAPSFVFLMRAEDESPADDPWWRVTEAGVTFGGRAGVPVAAPVSVAGEVGSPATQPGVLDAVYGFLSEQCGILWPLPGERAVAPSTDVPVVLPAGLFRPRTSSSALNVPHVSQESLGAVEAALDGIVVPASDQWESTLADYALWARRQGLQGGVRPAAPARPLLPGPCAAAWGFPTTVACGAPRHRSADGIALPLGGRWLRGPASFASVARLGRRMGRREAVDRFMACFDGAEPEVVSYYSFWEDAWGREGRQSVPDSRRTGTLPLHGLSGIGEVLFSGGAFDDGLALLHPAIERDLSADAARRLQQLTVEHDHARLLAAACAGVQRSTTDVSEFLEGVARARRLRAFRASLPAGLLPGLAVQVLRERQWGDLAGTDWCVLFDDATPLERMPMVWYYHTAPPGEPVHPAELDGPSLRQARWLSVRLDQPWDGQATASDSGSGTLVYAGRAWIGAIVDIDPELHDADLFLNLQGVPGKVGVYVNGQLLGIHGSVDPGLLPTSSRIRLNPGLDTSVSEQVILLSVEDNSPRPPGIWHVPWLSRGEQGDGEDGEDGEDG